MQVNVEKFLTMTALLAAASLPGCTIETSGPDNPTTGTTAAATGGAGAAGTPDASGAAGSAGDSAGGSSGSGGAAGSPIADASTDTSVGSDAASEGGICFAEDPIDAGSATDGGSASSEDCGSLPSVDDVCTDDAGVTGSTYDVCMRFAHELKIDAFQQLFGCLQAIPKGSTSCAVIDDCTTQIFDKSTCSVPDGTTGDAGDGGVLGCAQIVADCPATDGGAGITLQDCTRWLHPFNAQVRQAIFECYADPTGNLDCRDKFENYCVFPTDE